MGGLERSSLDDIYASSDELPARFGRYTLLFRLATGGMAELFVAVEPATARPARLVAIKRILPSMTDDPAFVEMLVQEARVAATLSHPGIVQTYEAGVACGAMYISMEYIHGRDIRNIVCEMQRKEMSEFPLAQALAIVIGVCQALAYAHEMRSTDGTPMGIVHRDVSPQNVLVTFDGHTKLIDFGIAKTGSGLGEDTRSGRLKGKVSYMSPEHARGDAIDWRTDIFAAGVMLFELTTGKRLFFGGSDLETLRMVCDCDYPNPAQVCPGYPPRLAQIVMRAIQKDRSLRTQSAREMLQELESFARDHHIDCSSDALGSWMRWLFADRLREEERSLQEASETLDRSSRSEPRPGVSPILGPTVLALVSDAGTREPTWSRSLRSLGGGLALATVLGLLCVGSFCAVHALRGRVLGPSSAWGLMSGSSRAACPANGTIRVVSEPSGASIRVNGVLQSQTTPAAICCVYPGTNVRVEITKPGHASVIREFTVEPEEAQPQLAVQLERLASDASGALSP